MTDHKFPQYKKSQRIGKRGAAEFAKFVEGDIGWIFRIVHQENDFGIDGYIDVVDDGNVTGKSIAVQIKCGDSYWNSRTEHGIRYNGETKHLNYYLNINEPIIFVVYNADCTEGCWDSFEPNRVIYSESGWWVEIPNYKTISGNVVEHWKIIAGEAMDLAAELQMASAVGSFIEKSKFTIYRVSEREIKEKDYSSVWSLIEQLSRTQNSLLEKRNSLQLVISGYDDDFRELYEISEVRDWITGSIEEGIPWFYFLSSNNMHNLVFNLKMLLLCSVPINIEKNVSNKHKVDIIDQERHGRWFEENFINLNEFASCKNLPIEIVQEVSEGVFDYFKKEMGLG